MIHGMYCRKTIPVASLSVLFCLIPSASAKAHPRLGFQSTPTLEVFVYGFPGLSSLLLEQAESEADRILRPVPIRLDWVNCIYSTGAPSCSPHPFPGDLAVQIRPKAFPHANASVLGFADADAAFLFYDRIAALRTEKRFLYPMLGRVLAHEITHLLLPNENHSEFGLMRGQWSTSDLIVTSTACRGLSNRAIQLMYWEALRRTRLKGGIPGK
jgi:hypothetical protein